MVGQVAGGRWVGQIVRQVGGAESEAGGWGRWVWQQVGGADGCGSRWVG